VVLDKFKPRSRTICGHQVDVVPFPARRAIACKFKLAKLLGTPIIGALKGFLSSLSKSKVGVNFSLLDVDLSSIPDTLLSTIEPTALTDLIVELCSSTSLDGRELTETVIDSEFIGDLSLLYKVVFFVLEVNFKDFFDQATIDPKVVANLKTKFGVV
jgi:hypothetical protein